MTHGASINDELPRQWHIVPWSQWAQTYYELRSGKLYLCHNDNKDQCYSEDEVEIDGFLAKHATSTNVPYPEIVAFIKAQRTNMRPGQ